jgi:hypothetical protein
MGWANASSSSAIKMRMTLGPTLAHLRWARWNACFAATAPVWPVPGIASAS